MGFVKVIDNDVFKTKKPSVREGFKNIFRCCF
jgi:hypothetical protein